MHKLLLYTILLTGMASCQRTEIFKGQPTMNQKLFLDTKAYAIDQADRIINGGFTFIETTQIPGGKIDTAYLKGNSINWDYYINKLQDANLSSDTNNCYRYSMRQVEDFTNVKVTLHYEPNYKDLKFKQFFVVLSANDSEVKTVFYEKEDNGFFNEINTKLTYVPGSVIQVYTKSKNLFGTEKAIIKSIYFMNGDMHKSDQIELVQ